MAPSRSARGHGPRRISPELARRIALAAQGFDQPRLDRPATMRDLQRVVDRIAQFQIDSINVVTRAHFMPLFSRLGSYHPDLLARAAHRAPRRLFEYWGHAASLIDVRLQPNLRWRMAAARDEAWGSMVRVAEQYPDLIDRVLAEIAEHGPITARQIDHDEERRRDHWGWNWSAVKTACEWLLWSGQITSAGRNSQFERRYALPEQVLPAAVVASATPSRREAIAALIRRAAAALGIAGERCLRDYFRTSAADTRTAIEDLVETGELEPVTVPGWAGRQWLWHEAKRPRSISASALVSPFDSLVFERSRLKSLFGVDYKIEIYVPAPQRRFGYYSYCFLHQEAIVARVDLKADRAAAALEVRAAWRDPSVDGTVTDTGIAGPLAEELTRLAEWQGLETVRVRSRGDLAGALKRKL